MLTVTTTITDFALGSICCILIVFLGIHAISRLFQQPRLSHSTVTDIREFLGPCKASLPDMLLARAIPNQRLVSAFGLTNTFVSPDTTTHNLFKKQATSFMHNMLRDPCRGWTSWAQVASHASQVQLRSSPPNVPFDILIQSITFRIIIIGLLNPTLDPESFIQSDINFITSTINALWDQSKNGKCQDPSLLAQLNSSLRTYLPDEEHFPNPLDFIIPTWESLWRVVAIALAETRCDQSAHNTFLSFLADPTAQQFDQRMDSSQPSVGDFIVETLRLYPPTKRISRAAPERHSSSWLWPVLQYLGPLLPTDACPHSVAEIETVQRSRVWSNTAYTKCADVNVFDATRHKARTTAQTETLMPFGYGRLGCVAKDWAPMAAGLIVAAVMQEMELKEYEMIAGEKIGGRTGWEGWVVRSRLPLEM
ncbi:hypothetical protein FIBSPDRAFT_823703 [Athelia psychrophila]|uniref:Cytochrome P450 n=1 Tax=Athelia psychrophila TaxID=1759441 RepID=A0A166LUZ1_9AGAM|nr:hypothetical protein FIBSPDRAFT_823703 [Fibularhizoctonia sp. CBS 109695]